MHRVVTFTAKVAVIVEAKNDAAAIAAARDKVAELLQHTPGIYFGADVPEPLTVTVSKKKA